jgi:hypothetical protein
MSSSNVSVETEFLLGALQMEHKTVRDQLSILRQTRGQRNVGSVTVPGYLRVPDVVRITAPQGTYDPRSCATCGRGLVGNERGPSCTRCQTSLDSDAGVEARHGAADVLPARG